MPTFFKLYKNIFRETDRDVVGAAASIFIVASVKIPKHALDLVSISTIKLNDQRAGQLCT